MTLRKHVLKHFHMYCGLGGGAKGFNRSKPILGNLQADWQCLGGVDVDSAELADFERLSGVKGTLIDLFTHDQYIRFHASTWWSRPGYIQASIPPTGKARTFPQSAGSEVVKEVLP